MGILSVRFMGVVALVFSWNLRGSEGLSMAPVANGGGDQKIKFGATLTLDGSQSYDPDGTIEDYHWELVSGGAGVIISPGTAVTDVVALGSGDYVFRLTVTDNNEDSNSTEVNVHVNYAPRANAGWDHTVVLPDTSVLLEGTGTDWDGTIQGYEWKQLDGPQAAVIAAPNSANTTVSGLVLGTYTFRLTVTDDMGNVGFSDNRVTVTSGDMR